MQTVMLYATNQLVKGFTQLLIMDLQRLDTYAFDPKFEKILYVLQKGVSDTQFAHLDDEFRSFLKENELVFTCSEADVFPEMIKSYESLGIIENVIIELNEMTSCYLQDMSKMIDLLTVQACFVRIKSTTKEQLTQFLVLLNSSTLRSMELAIDANLYKDIEGKEDFWIELLRSFPRVKRIVVFSAGSDKVLRYFQDAFIVFRKNEFPTFNREKRVSKERLHINQELYFNNHSYNSYFSHKLFIRGDGSIMNAPEYAQVFGNIENPDAVSGIQSIIRSSIFQKYWRVKKDDIEVCKDCEFRYMCVDSRLPKQKDNGHWYFDTECRYNPYIGKWEDEEGYQTLKECGIFVS